MEADVTRCLIDSGHTVEAFAVYDDVFSLVRKLKESAPDIVFNIMESFRGDRSHEPKIPALLDLLGVPYTGSGPEGLYLCKDKPTTKKLLMCNGVKTAPFVVSSRREPLKSFSELRYPVFVKPAAAESSEGIGRKSYARHERAACDRANFIHQQYASDALIEEYIDGRELYVGVIRTEPIIVLPPVELLFTRTPDAVPLFATSSVKWNNQYRKRWGIRSGTPRALPEGAAEEIARIATRTCAALKIRGMARLDLRLAPDGEIYVLEVNSNPPLARDDTLPRAAASVGICYARLIGALVEMAAAGPAEPLAGLSERLCCRFLVPPQQLPQRAPACTCVRASLPAHGTASLSSS